MKYISVILGAVLVIVNLAYSQSVSLSSLRLAASKQEVLSKMGNVSKAKIVFQMKNKIYYVDYSEATPQIRTISAISNAVAPDISPDGRYITYDNDTGKPDFNQDRNGPATTYMVEIREDAIPIVVCKDSAFNPRFVKDSVNTPTIMYMTSCKQPLAYKQGRTVMRTINGTTIGAEKTICNGAFRGGMSRGGRYVATAEQVGPTFILDRLAASGIPSYACMDLLKGVAKDTVTPITLQTCNASISSSFRFLNYMLNLTTGSAYPTGFSNQYIGAFQTHEILPISNSAGRIVKAFRGSPFRKTTYFASDPTTKVIGAVTAASTFEQPEWSNHPYYVVYAAGISRIIGNGPGKFASNFTQEGITAINIKDSTHLNLIESTDTLLSTPPSAGTRTNIYYPCLWVELPATLTASTEDSTYLKPPEQRTGILRHTSPRATIGGIHLSNSILTAKDPLASVTVHQLTGALVKSGIISSSSPRTCAITSDMFPSRGTYFIRAKTINGERATFRMTIAR